MVTAAVLTAILTIVAVIAVVAAHRRRGRLATTLVAVVAQPLPTTRTAGLRPQFTAGVRGSRAPPAAA
ncbi:hypothetical protein M1L60_42670 [Actinoplanes sp. TRM 88003]|uniref:Secreted protein n=1 Tax=Paractinoplanes aksuensis TaxID=2939490 RepID=A0ABT1E2F0_9ACTN|nr:hypothetical protein [Actinoplanes aksuensis]MCO8277302.1 hypothetical protein [Actinoplanes aksuensis]